jgi:Mrp family chromosome partitioning ATPase
LKLQVHQESGLGDMPVIAVINRKGGSGKSTLAIHLAAWLAQQGASVMLGDVARKQSTRAWLRRRDPALPAIMPGLLTKKHVQGACRGEPRSARYARRRAWFRIIKSGHVGRCPPYAGVQFHV